MSELIRSVRSIWRHIAYATRGGSSSGRSSWRRCSGQAAWLSWAEERQPAISRMVPSTLLSFRSDASAAQAILTSIATSIMTVVSIVFAILLMTLTLASTQFSPRLLVSFIRDRVTQWTLGVFLGTFCYCLAALPAVRSSPRPFVPAATVAGAMVLAPLCVGWLIFFIHISTSISVNHIIGRIRRDTEQVIDDLMPELWRPDASRAAVQPSPLSTPVAVASRQAGHVRYVDIQRLRRLAISHRVAISLQRRVGHFVPEGVPLMRVSHRDRVSDEDAGHLLAMIEIGPTRTLQQDIEFGVVQIVDIALRALSPAVNDPTTAISCVDHLSAILIRWSSRPPPATHLFHPANVLRIRVPWIGFEGLLDLAFEQIRHYALADAAVSLRLMRAFGDIAETLQDKERRALLVKRGQRLVSDCEGRLEESDSTRLRQRLRQLENGLDLGE